MLGQAFVPVAIAAIVLLFSKTDTAWKAFIVVLALLLFGQWPDIQRQRADTAAAKEVANAAREIVGAQKIAIEHVGNVRQPDSTLAAPLPPTSETATNDQVSTFQGVAPIMKEFSQRALREQQALADEQAQLGLDTILAPKFLTQGLGILEGRRKLKALSAIIDQQESQDRQTMVEYKSAMAQLMQNRVRGQEFMDGFERGVAKRQILIGEYIANERALLKAATEIVDFAELRLGKTAVQDGKIMFQSASEVDEYNTLTAEVERLAAKEGVLQQQMVASMEAGLKSVSAANGK
jgi:hypothetical protein